ncbi:MAG: gamma-glutamylcyclotransferase, partial [Solirubrobacterales bacterium]|nr:gamma-glutamylcyclotransferase [Solirubrobacterales bacterium]
KGSYVFTHRGSHYLTEPGGTDQNRLKLAPELGPTTFAALCDELGDRHGYAETERIPVFGYGSNSSPDALAHKFSALPIVAIPVIRCRVPDYDVVYSSHFSRGYVPGAIYPSRGSTLTGFLTCLTPDELNLMNATERSGVNYELVPLEGAVGHLDNGETIRNPLVYHSLHGTLRIDGGPVAVGGTTSSDRTFPEWTETRILEKVHALLAPELKLDRFIAICLTDQEKRDHYTELLKQSEIGSHL